MRAIELWSKITGIENVMCGILILNGVVRDGLVEKVTHKQRPDGEEGVSFGVTWGGRWSRQGSARAEALRAMTRTSKEQLRG